MLAHTPVEFNYLETLAKTFIIPARQNQFIQENIFNNAPARRIAIAMITNSAFTGSNTENPIWYQQFDLRQIRKLRGSQPIEDFDAADNCRLYVTTMKAMNFQDDIPSIPIDNFKIRLRLMRARSTFYMISDNPNVSLGIVDCSVYTRRTALKDNYHKKRIDILAYIAPQDISPQIQLIISKTNLYWCLI